jgi:radical SAM protein with 4Fe4S-binding SPASM domain
MRLLNSATALSPLSPYVHQVGSYYYHSITGDIVAGDDPCPSHFLKGSERDVLVKRLFQPPEELRLLIVTTWGCNLRCPHCYVLHELKKPSKAAPLEDVAGLKIFVENHRKAYGKLPLYVSMLGGEALLADSSCKEILDQLGKEAKHIDMTTNLTVELTPARMEILRRLDSFCISIDGDQVNHDSQRRSPWSSRSPYRAVMDNLKILQEEGLVEKVQVQATLTSNFLHDEERCVSFIASILALGISKSNIKIGCIAPNKTREAGELWVRSRTNPEIRYRPCCSYRFMNNFVITPEGVHVDYFNTSKLGGFRDSMPHLAIAYKEHIMDRMPVLKDNKCINCPVMFMCWGSCSNSHSAKGCTTPSEGCGQAQLMGSSLQKKLNGILQDQNT